MTTPMKMELARLQAKERHMRHSDQKCRNCDEVIKRRIRGKTFKSLLCTKCAREVRREMAERMGA